MLASYNQWANRRLFDACGGLSETEIKASRPAYFGSILGTLNHVLVGDRSWLARLRGEPPTGYRLDQILCETYADLDRARTVEDERIRDHVAGLGEAAFGEIVKYTTTKGDVCENLVSDILSHVFNHQTHHRGQVHDLLCQTKVTPPELDLIYYLRATG